MDDVQSLLNAASEATGLSDFGGDSFREGLELLVRTLNDEARLNAAGERAIRERIVGHLCQRLFIEDWYRRHPEIDEEEIKAPLFGISLPRTGSSALSFLLSCDPDARYLRVWEAAQPCPPPGTVVGPDPRRTGGLGEAYDLVVATPHTPTGIDGAVECQDLMALDFKAQIFGAYAHIPTYSEWLLTTDLGSTYLYERRALKLLQWRQPRRPWRLKAPTHLLYLDHLVAAFPDARFVMTHRDPAEVIPSVTKVFADLRVKFSDHVDLPYLGAFSLRTWAEGMRRTMAFRANGADHRFYDIDFRAMHADPVGEVRGLYAWLGEPVSEAFADNMAAWWQQNDRERERIVRPDPAIYGLDPVLIAAEFDDYRREMRRWTAPAATRDQAQRSGVEA